MPPRPKSARLWFRPARHDSNGRQTHDPVYVVLDSGSQISTGTADREEAEKVLAAYLNEKHTRLASSSVRDPTRIPVADVIAIYARDVVASPTYFDPIDARRRLSRLLDFFGNMMLSEINGAVCRRYWDASTTRNMARRDLEDLRAAINHHRHEGLCDKVISVKLPERPPPRERWLDRSEFARLLRACWRRPKCKHLARYLLVSIYTGRRASVVCSASFVREPGRTWIDLDRGMMLPPERARVTNKRNPPVPLPPRLLVHLRAWRKNGQRYPVEWNGRPIKRSQTIRLIARKIGLPGNVTPHVLRHSAATWLMLAGTDIWQASRYLGMTVRTLESIYAHHHPDYLEGAKSAWTKHPVRDEPVKRKMTK
jgi:integrase